MYVYYNPNPIHESVGDCTVRAISRVLKIDWHHAYLNIVIQGYMTYNMPSANRVWGDFLETQGFIKYSIDPSCPNCYTIKDFCKEHPKGTYVLGTGDHVVAVVNGDYFDTWDSGNEIPIYYFEKEVTND